jgi:hypothetical protein
MLSSISIFLCAIAISLLLVVTPAAAANDCKKPTPTSCADGVVHWVDGRTGAICDPLDCSNGADIVGCAYTGGSAISQKTSYLSCWTKPTGSITISSQTIKQAAPATTTTTGTEAGETTAAFNTSDGSDVASSTSGSPASPTSTGDAGSLGHGSLMAVAGAAIGAIVLV